MFTPLYFLAARATAAVELVAGVARLRARRDRLRHRPSVAQLQALGRLGGQEVLSYRLDPDANWMPRGLICPGDWGLAFTFTDADGRMHETVVLPGGERFELFQPTTGGELADLLLGASQS
jgi:hypothetical protein